MILPCVVCVVFSNQERFLTIRSNVANSCWFVSWPSSLFRRFHLCPEYCLSIEPVLSDLWPPCSLLQTLVKPTVAKAFLASMQDLNVTLLSTTCNFIRCIKPNAAMQCGVYSNR